jgi:hypothetical protein
MRTRRITWNSDPLPLRGEGQGGGSMKEEQWRFTI